MKSFADNFKLKLIVYQEPGLFFKESKGSWSSNSSGIDHFPLKLYMYVFYVAMPTKNCVNYLYSLRRYYEKCKKI